MIDAVLTHLGVSFYLAFLLYGAAALLLQLIKTHPLFYGYSNWLYNLAKTKPNLAKPLGLCEFCFMHWVVYILAAPIVIIIAGLTVTTALMYVSIIFFTTTIYKLCQ